MTAPRDVAAVLLAAGSSRRLGRPKQLEDVGGVSLVRRAALALSAGSFVEKLVVVGPRAAEVAAELDGLGFRVVENPDHALGVGTSIRAGVLAASPGASVLIGACDQPNVDGAHVARLLEAFAATAAPLAVSSYAGALGVPAVFDASLRGELAALAGDTGGKAVVARHAARAVVVPLAGGEIDVDDDHDLGAARAALASNSERSLG